MLLISSSTVLFAQIYDSITCYTTPELKLIANRVVRARECDTLLVIAEKQISLQDNAIKDLKTVISAKDSVIIIQDSIIYKTDQIVFQKQEQIDVLNNRLKKEKVKRKLITTGWIVTSSLLLGFIVNLILTI